jgi:hypothetical protein
MRERIAIIGESLKSDERGKEFGKRSKVANPLAG